MLLELRQVAKHYVSPEGILHPVLKEVSLTVHTGEAIAIVGPSGSGKSTLLNLMGALDQPDAGEITLAGQVLRELSEDQLARLRNREIGFIFQLHHLLMPCTVWENILLPTLPRAGSRSDSAQGLKPGTGSSPSIEQRAQELLQRVGMSDRRDYRPGQLSGGERQRVAVVRALINQPRLLLADEPTGALDHANAEKLVRLLLELNREHQVALVLVTHAMDLARQMDRVYRLADGELLAAS